MTGLYANNALHHKLFKQKVDWIKDPLLVDGMVMFRQRVGENGMVKSFLSVNSNSMVLNHDHFESGIVDCIGLNNQVLYANTSYTDRINDRWLIKTGASCSRDLENLTYNALPVRTLKSAATIKLVLTHLASEKIKIRFGSDVLLEGYDRSFKMDSTFTTHFVDLQPSLFLESEMKLTSKFALRLGVRSGYSSLLEEPAVAPRISAAYKTGEFSQVSMAWGKYRQKPQDEYLMVAPHLGTEKADHFILNFQFRNRGRIFRIESYLKQYNDLVKYESTFNQDPFSYNNNGFGSAHGIDLFWRDQKSLKGADYWISYSYLKTRRDYKDYPEPVIPPFASAHNLSLVYKQLITPISTFAGITYSFASGRPFNDKNSPEFMSGRTKSYNDISMNLTYITRLFKKDCIIHMNVTNLFGFKNVFGYRYRDQPGEDGRYASKAIEPNVGRQAVLLLMLSL